MQLSLAFILGVLGVLLAQHAWKRAGGPSSPNATLSSRPTIRVDVNRADRAELMQLPDIGPGRAEKIIAHRHLHGPFASVDQLEDVDGLGPKLVDRMRPYVYVTKDAATVSSPGKTRSASSRNAPSQSIDLNRAGRKELMELPGIGEVLADRIIADRAANGPYRRVSDITRVKGIKAKKLEMILPHVYVDEERLVSF